MADFTEAHSDTPVPPAQGLVGATLGSDVLHRLRMDIVSCTLKPGQRLRFESLRSVYGVSFSPLREALSRLASERLVVAEGQRGFRVAPVSRADLTDLTNVRVLVEQEALRLAIRTGGDDWEASVLGAFHRMDRLEARLGERYFLSPEWGIRHRDFHNALARASASPILLEIRDNLFDRAQRYRRISSLYRPDARDKDAEHRAIMEAALARDAGLASGLIERHIRQTADNVMRYAADLFDDR